MTTTSQRTDSETDIGDEYQSTYLDVREDRSACDTTARTIDRLTMNVDGGCRGGARVVRVHHDRRTAKTLLKFDAKTARNRARGIMFVAGSAGM